MGACDISMTVKGDATREEVIQAFHAQQEEDRAYNGHRDGYSGDFQTVGNVRFHDKTFDDMNKAYDYCLDHAQKWDYVVAVKVVNDKFNKWLLAGWGAE